MKGARASAWLAGVCAAFLFWGAPASGAEAFITDQTGDEVSVLDLKSKKVVARIPVLGKPAGIAMARDGRAAGAEKVLRETAARSTRDHLNTLAAITGKGAGFRSLTDTWADTTTAHGRLMLTVLGGLAEFERELIRARASEGRARAKARGHSLGRPFNLLNPHQRQEAVRRLDKGEETLVEIGAIL